MKIIFFGSSEFAIPSLRRLVSSRHVMPFVVTQPDRPKGRHLHIIPTPVKKTAQELRIDVLQPLDCSDPVFIHTLKQAKADIFVIIAYGQLLPESLLHIPKHFCINLHASLLPKYRGAAPINWAIANGETKTGLTIFKLDPLLDHGDILLQEPVSIDPQEDAVALSHRLSHLGAELTRKSLKLIESDNYELTPQPKGNFVPAPKLKKTDGLVDWSLRNIKVFNRIRGLQPWPGAYTYFCGKIFKIIDAEPIDEPGTAKGKKSGAIVDIMKDRGIFVQCGKGLILIKTVQLEGSKKMDAYAFSIGKKIPKDFIFG